MIGLGLLALFNLLLLWACAAFGTTLNMRTRAT
jgi:hypothetical protein